MNSSVISMGAVESVTPPQYLFRTASNEALILHSSGTTSTGVTYNVSYYEG